jgi:hypothetical protein
MSSFMLASFPTEGMMLVVRSRCMSANFSRLVQTEILGVIYAAGARGSLYGGGDVDEDEADAEAKPW